MKIFKGIVQLLKNLFWEKEEITVEISQISKLPKEFRKQLPKKVSKTKYFIGYRMKIRGKFKPKTAHEKRLWNPNAKIEDEG